MERKKYLGLIPARSGSKRIRDKNIRPFHGKPLIQYTIEAALESKVLDRVIVTTNDAKIADMSKSLGAEVPFVRPDALATDNSPTVSAIKHALNFIREESNLPDAVVILQPTSPLRTAKDISAATEIYNSLSSVDTLVSISEAPIKTNTLVNILQYEPFPLLKIAENIDGEDSDLVNFRMNGAIYVTRPSLILEENKIFGDKVVGYLMSEERSVDIDTEIDWFIAECLLKRSIGGQI